MLEMKATNSSGSTAIVSFDSPPDSCPICHFGIEAIYQGAPYVFPRGRRLEILFRCPIENCQRLFITRYTNPYASGFFRRESLPFEPLDAVFSESIEKLSPNFCAIYRESKKAEDSGWRLVAGPGYRKALEFLIKDYLCGLFPDEVKVIKETFLGRCIANEKWVSNDRLRIVAARAAWLGNDEIHYLRQWGDKDLEDLKKLIDLTQHWIEIEETTKEVLKDMPEGKN